MSSIHSDRMAYVKDAYFGSVTSEWAVIVQLSEEVPTMTGPSALRVAQAVRERVFQSIGVTPDELATLEEDESVLRGPHTLEIDGDTDWSGIRRARNLALLETFDGLIVLSTDDPEVTLGRLVPLAQIHFEEALQQDFDVSVRDVERLDEFERSRGVRLGNFVWRNRRYED